MNKIYNFSHAGAETIEYSNTCVHCFTNNIFILDKEAFFEWRGNGKYAQDVFADLSIDDREILISGTHLECWQELFA